DLHRDLLNGVTIAGFDQAKGSARNKPGNRRVEVTEDELRGEQICTRCDPRNFDCCSVQRDVFVELCVQKMRCRTVERNFSGTPGHLSGGEHCWSAQTAGRSKLNSQKRQPPSLRSG